MKPKIIERLWWKQKVKKIFKNLPYTWKCWCNSRFKSRKKKVVSGTPLSKNFEYECDVDGEIVSIDKVKRVIVQSESGENEVYIVPKETFKSDIYKVGTIVEPEEIIGDAKEYRAKFAGGKSWYTRNRTN